MLIWQLMRLKILSKYCMKVLMIFVSLAIVISSCSQSQSLGPGYEFDLFKNTPEWELAKAVEKEDTNSINNILGKGVVNIDFQEPAFGRTLLLLAVGNDKLYSTKVLLENGANLNIADFEKIKPIHEASQFISFKKNTLQILKLLIQYGANVNDILVRTKGNDTTYFYIPFMGACESLACAKLLINNGVNLYLKNNTGCCGTTYAAWAAMLLHNELDENIYVAKYIIVDKKISVPKYIDYNMPNKSPSDIFYYLNYKKFQDSQKEKARQDILNYLKQIDFPMNGVYK